MEDEADVEVRVGMGSMGMPMVNVSGMNEIGTETVIERGGESLERTGNLREAESGSLECLAGTGSWGGRGNGIGMQSETLEGVQARDGVVGADTQAAAATVVGAATETEIQTGMQSTISTATGGRTRTT